MKTAHMPEDYALVLQEVGELGEEEIIVLEESLRFDHARLMHILQNLRHKGLVTFTHTMYSNSWVRLSAKGQRLMSYLWPEKGLQPSY
jgi:DNA-binding PadR family transcriptional regulator